MSEEIKKKKGDDFLKIEKHNAEVESGHSHDLNASPRGRALERRINSGKVDDDPNAPADTE